MADPDTPEPSALDPDDPRVGRRADLLGEEREAGSDAPVEQAEAILEESDERVLDDGPPSGAAVEHRRSEDLVDPPGLEG